MDHLGDRVVKEWDGVRIKERHTLRHEFRMKAEELRESMRSETSVPFSFMDVKPERCLFYKIENELFCFVDMISPHMVESIVLTGGSSRTPVFKDKLRRIFPQTINAEEAAASGAVIATEHFPLMAGGCGRLKLYNEIETSDNAKEQVAEGGLPVAKDISNPDYAV